MGDYTPEVVKRMEAGEMPASPEEWKELAEILTRAARFVALVSIELDYVGHALDITEPLLEILAEAADSETKDKLREVVAKHEQESHGLYVSEVQEEDGRDGDGGPLEPGGGEPLPQEG